jgi:FAD/FMN-containing dehydrogenase
MIDDSGAVIRSLCFFNPESAFRDPSWRLSMQVKSNQDEIQSFLGDASNLAGGHAARVIIPESAAEVAEALAQATRERTPLTVAGAGTGIVGGRVPFGGVLLSDRKSVG